MLVDVAAFDFLVHEAAFAMARDSERMAPFVGGGLFEVAVTDAGPKGDGAVDVVPGFTGRNPLHLRCGPSLPAGAVPGLRRGDNHRYVVGCGGVPVELQCDADTGVRENLLPLTDTTLDHQGTVRGQVRRDVDGDGGFGEITVAGRSKRTVRGLPFVREQITHSRTFQAIESRQRAPRRAREGSVMAKILFLDVDGVLNYGMFGLHQPLLERLFRIVEQTGATVVLSSSWRDTDLLKDRLREAGVIWESETPDLSLKSAPGPYQTELTSKIIRAVPRCWEIAEWLRKADREDVFDVEDFAILDDDPDAVIPGHFYKTDTRDGLTDEIAEAIIARFNATVPP